MICLCNGVPRSKIVAAIDRGCTSLGKIFDATRAGCGPCGGTCQYKLRQLIEAKNSPKSSA